jgi:hypothetical protein
VYVCTDEFILQVQRLDPLDLTLKPIPIWDGVKQVTLKFILLAPTVSGIQQGLQGYIISTI